MPYTLKKLSNGLYKVKKNVLGPVKYFSKKGLPLSTAKKQLIALSINSHK